MHETTVGPALPKAITVLWVHSMTIMHRDYVSYANFEGDPECCDEEGALVPSVFTKGATGICYEYLDGTYSKLSQTHLRVPLIPHDEWMKRDAQI